jgi:glycosyltransferase involved in cell wall biosynthesis
MESATQSMVKDDSPSERAEASAELRADASRAAKALTVDARSDFAVLVPAFNEAPVIADLVAELKAGFERYGLSGDVVIVDDGSTDGTADLAASAGAEWSALKIVRHRVNLGKTEAMQTGAAATKRSRLVLFDADLQHLPDEIPRFLLRLQEGWDIVTGRKVGRYDKRRVSSVYNGLSRRVFRVPVSDLNSMKAFHRDAFEAVHLRHDWHRFFVVLAHAKGFSVTEIEIELHPRRAGESKYGGAWRVLVGLMDLVSVGFLLIFSRKPLLLFGSLGLILGVAGLGVGAIAFYMRFVLEQGFRPLLYLVMLLETLGVLLVGVGLLAEMVAQVREEVDSLRRRVGR